MNLLFLPFLVGATSTSTAEQHHRHAEQDCVQPVVASNDANDIITKVKTSPECWMNAMKAMHQLERDTFATYSHDGSSSSFDQPPPLSLGSIVCTAMTHDHKKALALELARCQMEDVGRLLFEETNSEMDDDSDNGEFIPTVNCSRPIDSTAVLHSCLARMTTVGMNAYSLFFTHVHQSCTRLTQEHLMQASQVATEQLHSMLAHHSEIWTEREERHQELLESLWNKAEEREKEIAELTKNMEATADRIRPLLGVESLVSMASNGVTWLTSLCYFLFLMNAIWLLTLSKRHDSTRRFMFRTTCIAAMLEFLLHWMATQSLLADTERAEGVSLLRSWTLALEGLAYIAGLLLSVFRQPTQRQQGQGEEAAATSERFLEMMQLVADNTEIMRKQSSQPRQERFVQEAAFPRQPPIPHPPPIHDDAPQDEAKDDDSTVDFLSLPPMLGRGAAAAEPSLHVGPSLSIPVGEVMDQAYAAAFQGALQALSRQASVAAVSSHYEQVSGTDTAPTRLEVAQPESPPQVILAPAPAKVTPANEMKKRCLEEQEDDDDTSLDDDNDSEEPEKKRARYD